MAIPTRQIALARFVWKLNGLDSAPEIPKPFTLRAAGEQETDDALHVVRSAYSLDPEWSGGRKHVEDVVLSRATRVLDSEPSCLFVLHGNRIIAASVYEVEPADGIHLTTGPCVLIEYRNRGIGGALLAATLAALRERGVREAVGQARPNTASAKFLCPKFGGQPVPTPSAEVLPSARAA